MTRGRRLLNTDPANSHLSLDDVGVYLSDAVDGVRAHDAQVRHVDPLAPVLFNQGHCPQLVHVFGIQSRDPLRAQSKRPSARVRALCEARECVSAYVEVDLVDLVDDLQVSGQERLQQVHGPAFQSFRQDCVVGVGKGAPGEVPGLQERGALDRNTVHCYTTLKEPFHKPFFDHLQLPFF